MEKESYLWHAVSEEEKEEIKSEAKEMMDRFADSLTKVDKELVEHKVERKKQMREETATKQDKNFRKIFFKNAPSREGDFIKAEKKGWSE